jgi:very-short-patch-repair endonuclease
MRKTNRSNPKMMHRAGNLRHTPTPTEAMLWQRLRNDQFGVNFRRQHAIGPYIVDFCCPARKLIIEVDGSQHLEQQDYDAERTAFLHARGYTVLRFWNGDVLNRLEAVLGQIFDMLEKPAADAASPPNFEM